MHAQIMIFDWLKDGQVDVPNQMTEEEDGEEEEEEAGIKRLVLSVSIVRVLRKPTTRSHQCTLP